MINEINNSIINDIIYLIKRNYFLNIHNLLLIEEKKQKELTFLQRKREEDNFRLRIKNDFDFQKEINFSISNSKEKNRNIKQKNESRNDKSDSLSYPINFEENSCKNPFTNSSDNPNPKESNKINVKADYKETNLSYMSSMSYNSFPKIKYFNIIKNISNKCPIDSNNNNEIKVLKNKKSVYIDRIVLNSYSTSRALKKLKQNKFVIRNKTSSKYRGVSKNGNNWQVLTMINNKRIYLGSYPCEEMATRVYDILSIKNRGIKARTNFVYNNYQKNIIKESEINIKSDNISNILKKLTN